jgi:hypothetical protein
VTNYTLYLKTPCEPGWSNTKVSDELLKLIPTLELRNGVNGARVESRAESSFAEPAGSVWPERNRFHHSASLIRLEHDGARMIPTAPKPSTSMKAFPANSW